MSAPKQSPFAIVPWEVAADARLGARELRVLIALLSFRARNTGLFFASREQISERCGMPKTRISEITGKLEKLGYLKKHGRGGRGKAVVYEFQISETVTPISNPLEPQNSYPRGVRFVSAKPSPTPVTVTKTVTVTANELNGYPRGGPPETLYPETHKEKLFKKKKSPAPQLTFKERNELNRIMKLAEVAPEAAHAELEKWKTRNQKINALAKGENVEIEIPKAENGNDEEVPF